MSKIVITARPDRGIWNIGYATQTRMVKREGEEGMRLEITPDPNGHAFRTLAFVGYNMSDTEADSWAKFFVNAANTALLRDLKSPTQ